MFVLLKGTKQHLNRPYLWLKILTWYDFWKIGWNIGFRLPSNPGDTVQICQTFLHKCSLKGLFTNFEYITFFSCPTERNIFYKRSISIKPLWLEINEKRGCTKSVRPSTIIYIIYITRTDFVHPIFSFISSQSGFIEMNLL